MLDIILVLLVTAFVISRVFKFISGLQAGCLPFAVGYTPGFRCALSPFSRPGAILPTRLNTLFTNVGTNFLWEFKRSEAFKSRPDVISVVPWLYGRPAIYVSSLEPMRQILGYTSDYDKWTDNPFSVLFGDSVATSTKETWKVHKRIMQPAFSQELMALVWKESLRNFQEMVVSKGWEGREAFSVPVVNSLLSKARAHWYYFSFTYSIVSSCAFGFPFYWTKPSAALEKYATIQEWALSAFADMNIRALVPRWGYLFAFKGLQRIEHEFNEIDSFLKSEIALRREKIKSEELAGDDMSAGTLFDNIVKANIDGGRFAFNEREVIANMFAVILAGHEGTSRTLTVALALLSLHQDEQDKAFREIMQNLSDAPELAAQDPGSFKHVQNIVREAVRLYPPSPQLTRQVMRDTQLIRTDPATGKASADLVLKKGTIACVDLLGIHYNPRYFPEPDAFKPSRWDDGTCNNDAFAGFGYGPRTCMGRKFGMIEATCLLVVLLRDWKVDVDLADGETGEAWRERVLNAKVHVLLGLGPVPIRFTRRK
ncbi:hypothetical protein BOTBODRAFT_165681 [Botryobasidium botryosum FD-172 SS1]|uniref:Cytochrome P450 n=1 Tax=Botryobasidium botryosum (strain FD-172 SS1) TaxID=930990 RepID=A0A067MAF5_BOTB1|nr:hypothetical protein BOTBODRAFT_165681 [Botryobasidium botryosum FD-172 SS1]